MSTFSKDDIPEDWRKLLGEYLHSAAWDDLQTNIQAALDEDPKIIRPEPSHFFKALALTSVETTKVIILGQDPYHSPGLAQGLAFSIPKNIPTNSRDFPSSLRNISKALQLEGYGNLPNGDLEHWAKQGVLLLNTALSVRLGEAGSHANLGWKGFVDQLISSLALQKPHLVWMLWGAHAQSKLPLIAAGKDQFILQSSHPSGLGVYKTHQPFLEPGAKTSCGHFSKANAWLKQIGKEEIIWVARTAQTDLFS
jgi:uracil-DNA glycosylase